MMRKILITGGAGFIASSLAERLAKDPENYVVIVDNLLTGSMSKVPKSVHQNVKFIKADANELKDISSIFLAYRFDYVFRSLQSRLGCLFRQYSID